MEGNQIILMADMNSNIQKAEISDLYNNLGL